MKFKIAANTTFQLIGKIVTTLTTLITTILIARNYGPEGYGNFTLITTFIAFFYLIADFGLNAVVLEKLQNPEIKKDYFKNLSGLRIIWSLFLVFLSVSILSFLPREQGFNETVRLGIIIFSLTIISQSAVTTSNAVFQNLLRYDLSALSLLTGSLINLILVFLFSSRHMPLIYIILSFIAGSFINALSSLFFAKTKDKEISILPSFNFGKIKEIFTNSLPLGITLVFNLVYFRADTFIIALTRNQAEVGNYGLAYRFFEFVLVFPTFFMNSLYPIFLSNKENPEYLARLVSKSFKILLSISLFITTIFLVVSPNLISIAGADGFTESSLALRLLSLSFPVFFLSSLYMWLLITLGKRKILAVIYGLSMILNIVLNLILIPPLGIPAAAITTGLGETLILILTCYLSNKSLKIKNYA